VRNFCLDLIFISPAFCGFLLCHTCVSFPPLETKKQKESLRTQFAQGFFRSLKDKTLPFAVQTHKNPFCNSLILCYNHSKCEIEALQNDGRRFFRSAGEEERIKIMTVDNTFMIKKLQAMKTLFAVYSPLTKMPYVECDQETFDDQIHLFADLEMAKTFCQENAKDKVPMAIRKLEEDKVILGFYHELYQNGVNAVVYHDEVNQTRMELETIIQIPDWSKMKQRPVFNPLIQLTAAYFFQEARRPEQPKDNPERNRRLHELEEEMLVNITRGNLLLPVIEQPAQEGEDGQKRLGAVIVKNNKDEVFQPIFTDLTELARMYPNAAKEFKVIAVPFSKLVTQVLKDSKGFVLNPAGFNMILNRQLLALIAQRFVQPEEKEE